MDPIHELQVAVIAKLKAATAVTAIVGQRVYDQPPAAAELPYFSIGPTSFQSADAECVEGGEVMLQLDAWSDNPGHPQVRAMADAARRALAGQDITLGTNALVTLDHWRTDFVNSGQLRQASIRFTAIVETP